MSKIYEALLQAEREKKAASGHRGDVGVSNLVPGVQTDNAFKQAEVTQDEAEGSVLGTSASSLRLMAAARMQVWRPDLEVLPSARLRGGKTEQFRSLRSKLTGLRQLQQMRSVAIVSGHSNEGKSFVASNLAITLARHKNSRVLLIDGDMRRGTLHNILGCPNEVGLAEYLSGSASAEQVFQRGQAGTGEDPLSTGLSNLTFCSCGHARDRASELSGSARFSELIKGLSNDFDWIVVDTSPVNIVSDGVNLARACDSALLVIRSAQTKYEAAQRAVKELKVAKVLGVVLNAASETVSNEGDYGYLGYGSVEK